MKVMTYEGVVENGCVQLSGGVVLPDKAKVYVVVPEDVLEIQVQPTSHIASPRLVHPEQARDFVKEVEVLQEKTDAGL